MANGPSRTMGLAKFLSNFMGLGVSFFSGNVRLTVLIIFQGRKVLKDHFVCSLDLYINDILSS